MGEAFFSVPHGHVHQMAFVVEDIHAAMGAFAAALRIGPWFHYQHLPAVDQFHRGEPTQIDMAVALAYRGPMMFELIQQHCGRPSVYKDVVEQRGYGFHHFGITTRDFDADVDRHRRTGHELLFTARTPRGNRGAYMSAPDALGGLIEYIEVTDASESFYRHMQRAALDWDGTEPVRSLD